MLIIIVILIIIIISSTIIAIVVVGVSRSVSVMDGSFKNGGSTPLLL